MPLLSALLKHLILPVEKTEDQQAQRLFHGRGHAYQGLHHLTIDWLPPVALITLFKAESSSKIDILANYLYLHLPHCKSVQRQHRYLLSGPIDVIKGDFIQQFVVKENDLLFNINLGQAKVKIGVSHCIVHSYPAKCND